MSSKFGFKRSSTKTTSESTGGSSKGHSWHKASSDRGKLPRKEYGALMAALNTHRNGEGYDLYWRKTDDGGVEAIVAKSAPAGEYQQSQGEALTKVTFGKGDFGNKSNWGALMNVEQYGEDADWEAMMARRGSVANNAAGDMPDLDTHGLT
ncbi:uncharacterized protein FOMMEDRAFT_156839 [Fomitiporia mediterranea MF3/22]|uniref:uncharacterized protein n=1 Tax=Fomitiporia mediterranea (strain MF3/22) TaxID=694068 RepID=UPI0004407EF4|nr:uncharacterized protein FOMMEDRAFT_156839 [Fomitiporia mediterranea MF3/22]EJD03431.1 hypothetical protein FOMMEDRAFT_156839 [Fomitiporia mediterranea MF3/22]